MDIFDTARALHKKLQGKIETALKEPVLGKEELSLLYTPGVAAISRDIAENPELAYEYTIKQNTVAVVSDGSAVLGLGDIGPLGALPVMEGKALLFKQFAGVNAVPICLDVHTADELVAHVRALAPAFGGINLEDIKAPICFEVEERLQDIGIPVFHDDQHGTAIVVYAGILNALKAMDRTGKPQKVVINGAGSAGVAIAKMLALHASRDGDHIAISDVVACDTKGIIVSSRTDLNESKQRMLEFTNREQIEGTLVDALRGADIFIGVSAGNVLDADMVASMAPQPIIFALANPDPEILPDVAIAAGAGVVATGRSDFPNQVNNVLVFPGIFKAALHHRFPRITNDMKYQTAVAIARLVEHPTPEYILPSVFDAQVADVIDVALAPVQSL